MYAERHTDYNKPAYVPNKYSEYSNHEYKVTMEKEPMFSPISFLGVAIILGVLIGGYMLLNHIVNPSYDVTYVEYQMERGDNLESVILDINKDFKEDYKVRVLVSMAVKENMLDSPNYVASGGTYKLPLIINK